MSFNPPTRQTTFQRQQPIETGSISINSMTAPKQPFHQQQQKYFPMVTRSQTKIPRFQQASLHQTQFQYQPTLDYPPAAEFYYSINNFSGNLHQQTKNFQRNISVSTPITQYLAKTQSINQEYQEYQSYQSNVIPTAQQYPSTNFHNNNNNNSQLHYNPNQQQQPGDLYHNHHHHHHQQFSQKPDDRELIKKKSNEIQNLPNLLMEVPIVQLVKQRYSAVTYLHTSPLLTCPAARKQLKTDLIDYAEHFLDILFPYTPTPPSTPPPIPISNTYTTPESTPLRRPRQIDHVPLKSITSFIRTVFSKTRASLSTLVYAFKLLGNLKKLHPNCKGSRGSSQRLILAAMMVASKYLYDDTFDNNAWSVVSNGLFPLEDVNKMELEFLQYCQYNLHCGWEEWQGFCTEVEVSMRGFLDGRDGFGRGRRRSGPLCLELKCWDEIDEGRYVKLEK